MIELFYVVYICVPPKMSSNALMNYLIKKKSLYKL